MAIYLYFLRMDGAHILGSSPEMLVRVNGRRLEYRPIAGTRPRGANDAEDKRLEEELRRTRRSHRVPSNRRRKRSSSRSTITSAKADPDDFDVVQDFSGPFPVEVITRMAGVPEDFASRSAIGSTQSLHRKPGQIDLDDDNMQANIESGMYYYGLVAGAAGEPAGRHDQSADRRRDPR